MLNIANRIELFGGDEGAMEGSEWGSDFGNDSEYGEKFLLGLSSDSDSSDSESSSSSSSGSSSALTADTRKYSDLSSDR